MQLRLDEVSSLSELLDTVEAYARKHPSGPDIWIEGLGWDQMRWNDTDGSFPTAVGIFSSMPTSSLLIPT